jgi:TonB-dependent starch-binding outer membrane protein SusC
MKIALRSIRLFWPNFFTKQLLLTMKLTGILLLATCLHLSATGLSQKVTFSGRNVTIQQIFKAIIKQTGVSIIYKEKDFKNFKPLNINVKEASFEEVLAICLKGQPLSISSEGNLITITPTTHLSLGLGDNLNAQLPSSFSIPPVTGVIRGTDGQPIAGANIIIKGTKRGVTTNVDGSFSVNANYGDVLLISSVGYTEKQITVDNSAIGSISLSVSASQLDDAVIIAYGTTTKRLNTGSVATVKSDDIEKQPVANPLSALQGRMTGVLVTNGNGLPGSNVNIQIRGINSIAAGISPLYIVDGIPFSSAPLNQFTNGLLSGVNGFLSPFNSINPSDIESVDVLKDADATAIYGSRAANGVVLITTKKGKSGKTKLGINYYSGIEQATNRVKFIDTKEYVEIKTEGFDNDGVTPTVQNAPTLKVFDQNAYTDLQKLLIGNTARVNDAQVDISGGNSNTRFLFGASYRKESTIYYGSSGYSRAGAKLGIDHNSSNNKFITSLTANFTTDNNRNIAQAYNFLLAPNFPLYDTLGNYNFVGGVSPAAYAQQISTSKTKNLISSGLFKYNLISSLSLQINLGYNYQTMSSLLIYPKASKNPRGFNPVSEARYGNNEISTNIVEPQINFHQWISHGLLNVLVGGSWQYTTTNGSFIAGENYTNDGLLNSLGSAGNISKIYLPASSYTEYKYASVFGRVNYNLADKYLLNASFRRDGSSRFGPNKQYGNFGAVGLGWIFSKETFITNGFPGLSFGKLRASYGVVGNDQIQDYQYLATYSSRLNYQGVSGLSPSRIANPNYSWELNHKLEAALDLGFFKDRILLNVSWFRNRSDNQLVGYPLPSQTGFTSYQANLPALVQNTGWEFALNTINIKSKNGFNWNTSFNLSTIDNKLISFPGLAASSYANLYEEGKSISIVKGYDYLRINPDNGIPVFSTKKGDETISPDFSVDRVVMGKVIPDFYGGLNNSFSYKGFDLSFLLQFVKQSGYSASYWPGVQNSLPVHALQRWRKVGDITDEPIASALSANNDVATAYFSYITSDRFWTDASFIRLKTLAFSYNFSRKFLDKIKMTNCKIFLQGQNLLTFTNYQGSDPELPAQFYVVPTLRIMTAGIQASF